MAELKKKIDLDEIISAAHKIVIGVEEQNTQKDLFGNTVGNQTLTEIESLLNSHLMDTHDADLAHDLYYGVIHRLVQSQIPKSRVRTLIQLLLCNLLSGVELLSPNAYRGSDSRQQSTDKLKEAADIILSWSEKPFMFMDLAQIVLDKCIEIGVSPANRTLSDFVVPED